MIGWEILSEALKESKKLTRFKYSILRTHVSSTQQAGATNETAREIRKNISIKIGHDHNIKLLRSIIFFNL
jgi:hypothetical protein